VAVLTAFAIPKLTSTSKVSQAAPSRRGGGDAPPVTVRAYVVQQTRLDDRILVTGTVLPNEQIDLHSEVPGKIMAINFREGSTVRKGTLLVKINDADLRAQLRRAVSRKELAESKERRQRTLREKQAISQAEYDEATSELSTTAADIDLIKAQIAKTEIRAPFSGMIGLRYVSEGSYISPTTRIAGLHNINPVKIDFSVPEKYYSIVRPGSAITFRIQGSEKEYTGRVYAVEPKIDQSTRTLQVRAICDNGNGQIFPGAFAEIELVLKRMEDALVVPTEAIVPELQGQKVFIAKGGAAEPRKVEIGIRTGKGIQILSGLAVGDTVVTDGIVQVKPGSKLKITGIENI
jgi:membrane fusion protein (multidrug efflux system)